MIDKPLVTASSTTYEEANRCPMDFFAKARREAPVVKLTSPIESRCGYAISRYRDVVAAAKDFGLFSSAENPQARRWVGYNEEVALIYREQGWPLVRTLVWCDPPDHVRFRRLSDRIFTPERVDARQEHIRICVDKLIDKFKDGGRIDGMTDFAGLLPAMVMTREFGAPEDDYLILLDATNAVGASTDITSFDPADADLLAARAARATTIFQHYMAPRIEAARINPSNTMLSDLANAREGEDFALSLTELMSLLLLFLIAATHSTTGMLGWALHALAEHQDVQQRLRDEPRRIGAFIEEVLRVRGIVLASFRTATRDAEVAGLSIPAGSQVFLRWDSGNFDVDKWADPERFDIDRKGLLSHLAFGAGAHSCVGSTLARRELAMSISNFLDRFKRIEFAGDAKKHASFSVQTLTSLPLLLTV